ncbi:hypothetical protein N7494_002465 [Penicillium frequentans]|uniref:Amino acid permease/ SLC12A domain-containing protein n=1 Tax=Penicillium frequentans TaxID=3151616 RepID=A0AAD6D3Q3_9EURO|nr:hypothetical protein N7494_002465 [Penicillium glabrum]
MLESDCEKQTQTTPVQPSDSCNSNDGTQRGTVAADRLARKLSPRQVQMIAIGGTIGTGLFLGTGKALAKGGPASMLIAYAVCGGIVFVTMLSLGEMVAFMPIAGSFLSVASDIIALQISVEYWTNTFPGWALSLICLAFVLGLNFCSVKVYGETEYWLSLLKVVTIIAFIIVRIVVNCGANTQHTYFGDRYFYVGDAPFVGGIKGFASVFVTASFAYGGTENVAITAGETKNAARTYPSIIRNVFWRIILFYIVSVALIGLDVPYTYPGLSSKTSATSPFTIVFQEAGSAVAGSFINAVVMTSAISAANHALFAGSRLMYTLAIDGYAPRQLSRLNRFQIPWIAVLATAAISALCFGASKIGAGQVWTWLQNMVGVSNQISWACICFTSLRFRAAIRRQNLDHLLPFKNFTYPVGPAVAVVLNIFLVLIQGWSCFSPDFDAVSFVSYYIEVAIMIVMVVGWKVYKGTKLVPLDEMDLFTDQYDHANEGINADTDEQRNTGFSMSTILRGRFLKQAVNWLV